MVSAQPIDVESARKKVREFLPKPHSRIDKIVVVFTFAWPSRSCTTSRPAPLARYRSKKSVGIEAYMSRDMKMKARRASGVARARDYEVTVFHSHVLGFTQNKDKQGRTG